MHDAVIVGGSYAGLAAAMPLVRARRRVLVIDDGKPRNRFSPHAHGFLTQDGRPGGEIAAAARAQVAAYPTAEFRTGRVVEARKTADGFGVALADGSAVEARRVLLAHGVEDVLPDIPGAAERWGKTALHCPYCHGYEIGGGAIGVLGTSPMSVHYALLIADWGEVTFFQNGAVALDAEDARKLSRRGVAVEPVPIAALEGDAPGLDGVRLADGRLVPLKAIFLGQYVRQPGRLAEMLGCAIEDTPVGQILKVDQIGQTNVPGVFAAGDAARAAGNVTLAAAAGTMAGTALHRSLVEEDSM